MSKSTFVIYLFFFSVLAMAQNTKAVFTDSVQIVAGQYFGKDILGYDYYAKNNILYKQKKSEKWEYKNLSLGEIHPVDLINPLKILIFYKEFNSVVLLDNQLSEIMKITLNGFNLVAQTCSVASQNRFWIYDNLSNQLVLFDYLNKKANPINQPFKNTFKYYNSHYNYWMRISEENEIYTYDNYGKVTQSGKIPTFEEILITDSGKILFTSSGNLYLYQVDKNTAIHIFSFEKKIEKFDFKNGFLTLFTGDVLYNYKINLP